MLRNVLIASVAILCAAVAVLLVLLLHTTSDLRATRDRLLGEVQAARQLADEHGQRAVQLQGQLAAVVRGRLPKPLGEMLTDQLIPLDQAPVRSILFTQTGTADRPGFEYRLACRNDGTERFQSRVRILLFSETGVQTGTADVRDSDDWNRLGAAGLAPGEAATFSGQVTLQFEDPPKYFLVLTMVPDGPLPRLSP